MTTSVYIDLDTVPPTVYINGHQTGCRAEFTYHREGGLNIQSLRLTNIPVVPEADEGMKTVGRLTP